MTRYVVSLRRAGLGDRLICLAAAWLFARNTGRTLVADWRFGAYSAGGPENLFDRFFDRPARLGGVPLIADQSVAQLVLSRPRYPPLWEDDRLFHARPTREPSDVAADRDVAVELIRSRQDSDAHTVVFDGCINEAVSRTADCRTFFEAIRPLATMEQRRRAFREAHFGHRPVIGLHVRHGNGGDVMGHARFWRSVHDAVARCERAVGEARRRVGSAAPVYLCTDSVEIQREITARLPHVLFRPKYLKPEGTGELHLGSGADATCADALIDMLLLADCDVLIRYPPTSFFSLYGAVMGRNAAALTGVVRDLQCPWDPGDTLAPAILM